MFPLKMMFSELRVPQYSVLPIVALSGQHPRPERQLSGQTSHSTYRGPGLGSLDPHHVSKPSVIPVPMDLAPPSERAW